MPNYAAGKFCHIDGTTYLIEHALKDAAQIELRCRDLLTDNARTIYPDKTPVSAFSVPKPTYPMGGKTAALRVRQALAERGFVRSSCLNGANLVGWIPQNVFGSTGYSVKFDPDNPKQVIWNVVISGKPHLMYEEEEENQGTDEDPDYIDFHHPVNPDSLGPALTEALTTLLGLNVISVRSGGYQTHWDDDVDFRIITTRPDWLVSANT